VSARVGSRRPESRPLPTTVPTLPCNCFARFVLLYYKNKAVIYPRRTRYRCHSRPPRTTADRLPTLALSSAYSLGSARHGIQITLIVL